MKGSLQLQSYCVITLALKSKETTCAYQNTQGLRTNFPLTFSGSQACNFYSLFKNPYNLINPTPSIWYGIVLVLL